MLSPAAAAGVGPKLGLYYYLSGESGPWAHMRRGSYGPGPGGPAPTRKDFIIGVITLKRPTGSLP